MSNLPLFSPQYRIDAGLEKDSRIVLHTGDAKEFIASLPDRSVSLIFTSPPYNLGKDYENRVSIKSYLEQQAKTIRQLHRVLKDDGSICWQVGNFVEDGEVFPLDILFYDTFKSLNMSLRNRIIWHFDHGLHASKRFSGRYETILWFTKTDKYVFNLDSVRVAAKYPGKRHYKGPNKGKPSGNPKGKNPSDAWEIVCKDWGEGYWEIPNVKCNHPEKTAHPCQFPVELVERCVLALTNEGDWVFDPYAGVGSTLIAAIKNDRKAMGAEKEVSYCQIARERIQAHFSGTLQLRPLGKPVYVPSGREKVSLPPEEWGEGPQGRLLEEKESYG